MWMFLLAFVGVISVGVGLYALADRLLNRNPTIGAASASDIAELQAQKDKMAHAREDATTIGRGNTMF
jgi:hypothetical protein